MEKLAKTRTPIHDLIGRRWSPRAFASRSVEADKLRSVFEAARWAASSRNEQPWAYLVAARGDPKGFEDLLGVLAEFNRAWAQHAPVLILTLAHLRWNRDAAPNRHGLYDLGQASAMLAIQATALGLAIHQMGGFDVEAARERFRIPADWEPVSEGAQTRKRGDCRLPRRCAWRISSARARNFGTTFRAFMKFAPPRKKPAGRSGYFRR